MQIIKYKWENWKPFLVVKADSNIFRLPLLDKDVFIKLGRKICTGYLKNGEHFPCPNNSEVEYDSKCPDCKKMDDFFLCTHCSGECINPRQRGECKNVSYFIYLAAFDSLLKVGVSVEFRLLERLVEQGADFAAKVAFVKDGMLVRRIEQNIKASLNVNDRIVGLQKHNNLFSNPNTAIRSIANAISRLKGNGLDEYLVKPEIYDLRRYYRLDNVLLQPSMLDIKDGIELNGTVVAAKGNLIVFKRNGYFTVNAHRLIGREVTNPNDFNDLK